MAMCREAWTAPYAVVVLGVHCWLSMWYLQVNKYINNQPVTLA
jgi:hypothetical protein